MSRLYDERITDILDALEAIRSHLNRGEVAQEKKTQWTCPGLADRFDQLITRSDSRRCD